MIKTSQVGVSRKDADQTKKNLNAYSLAGIGIGGIIGAGFFLGSGLAVNQAGPSVVLAFIIGGLVMRQVLGAMTSINVNRLAHGSFRVYTEQLLGSYAGFLIGWAVLLSGILGMGSEALAMGVFVQYWLPHIPVPIISLVFTGLVIGLNALGIQNFGRLESIMAFVKALAIIVFVVLGGYALITIGTTVSPRPFSSVHAFLPNGISGFLQSMLIVIFTYSGISAVAMASHEVREPRKDIPKAASYMSLGVITLYTLSMVVLVSVIAWSSVYTKQSPFVQALDQLGFSWASASMNVVILLAAFSVMAATFYASMQMLISLAESQKAPAKLTQITKHGFYRNAWIAVGIACILVVGSSFVFPPQLFNYLVSASSYFTFLNWSLNLVNYLVWLKKRGPDETYESPLIQGRIGAYGTIGAIAILLVISLRVTDFRMGFYAALAFVAIISVSYWIWSRFQPQKIQQS